MRDYLSNNWIYGISLESEMKNISLKSLKLNNLEITVYTIMLGIILVIGFILRTYGNNFGLPMLFHPDEPTLINRAINIIETGDLNPHFFNYPSLLIYIYAIIFKIGYVFERIGLIHVDRSLLYLTGRFLSAFMGTLAILIVYYIGKILYSKNVGIVAAAFLAVMPLAVGDSHYATVDTPLYFFVCLSFLYVSLMLKNGSQNYYMLAGITAGLAASTKYNGGLMLLPVFVAHVLYIQNNIKSYGVLNKFKNTILNKNLFISIAFSGITYICTSPYTVLDFEKFWHDFIFETQHMTTGHGVLFVGTPVGWIYHFEKSLRNGMTYNLEILATLGVISVILFIAGYIVFNRRFKSKLANIQSGILLLSWFLPFYLIIGSWEVKFDRYVLPLLPFLALFSANLLVDTVNSTTQIIITKFKKNTSLKKSNLLKTLCYFLVLSVLIATPFQNSIEIWSKFSKEDTRQMALQWLEDNIPQNSIIIREQYAPEVELIENVTCINYNYGLSNHNVDEFIENNVNYVVVSSNMYGRFYSHPEESTKQIQFYDSLDTRCELLKVFRSSKDHPGPEIKIYRILDVSMPIIKDGKI